MTTIGTGTTLGVTLTTASYTNPVIVASGVTISNGGGDGIAGAHGPGEYFILQNHGTIYGSDGGVALYDGGSVTNLAGGEIVATAAIHSAVYIGDGAGTVINAGAITGDGASGVDLQVGGGVTNQAGGTIGSGGTHTAVYGTAATVAVVNAGLINGIDLLAGGSVVNQATGTIERAGLGVYIAGAAGTVINAGTIAGTGTGTGTGTGNPNAVVLRAGYANRVVVAPGATFAGVVSGGNTAGSSIISTLELVAATSAGTLAGLGTQFVDFGAIAFDAGAQWSIAGIANGLAGTISGFAPGDTIELTGVTATGSSHLGTVLTLDQAGGGSVTLDLPGPYTHASDFDVATIAGGTEVTVACFRAGTRILTASGEVAVDALRIGDRVATLRGCRFAPIVWLGHRSIATSRHPRPHDVWPIRVQADAIADGVPHRDLWLSPEHAVLLSGEGPAVLVPIRHLLNGSTIAQVPCGSVTYWHIELARHDAIVAEGLPAETYLDTGNRADFANGWQRRIAMRA